ncbi:MAG: flavodoxin-dependent (E)-4-hydroxy-3-methylbut-2-enyl-diphosphate synthase [Pseudomonadota bacterium]
MNSGSDNVVAPRRLTRKIWVGKVAVGGDAPISVQTMTNTKTTDVAATVAQIHQLENAGVDIVRVSVPTMEAAEAFGIIRKQVQVPLVADIHFDYKIALAVAAHGADCLRINPGNIGHDDKVRRVIDAAAERNIPIRIGVNAGSLEKSLQRKYGEPNSDALVESAMRHVEILHKHQFDQFKLSLKASNVAMTVAAYRKISKLIDQPLHLGVTEAGIFRAGTVKSAIALGTLLMEGIGDTIRISLAADPVQEVKVGFDILKSLGLRTKGVNFIACPGCSRQNFDVIETMNQLEARLEDILEPIDVAVIGCIVNGPGEAREAEIGLTGGSPMHLIFREGKPFKKITTESLVDTIEEQVRERLYQRALKNENKDQIENKNQFQNNEQADNSEYDADKIA